MEFDDKVLKTIAYELALQLNPPLSGTEVVAIHRCVTEHVCAGRTGWEALECIVNEMRRIYDDVKELGVEEALRRRGCWVEGYV